ncbi:T9SS type A sorting domain-containing protein [Flavobacterium jejuense]|uniref:T9SS type A sorting domain-containing protein n=1 Tax=Flavobacterium jejuense TaxID=1544455 RepID=A0ABX0IVW7_9FLAO|nr:FG-GAP-like repeat-containing protein [Flavobacterium jejuense]NHN27711.1 T9SS type A sorting domain-containing protein [Flavobacterium jejuense]
MCAILSWQINFSQNTCATAAPVTAGLITVDAIDGTNISTNCSQTPTLAEWYAYTPTQNYSVTITSDLSQNICKDTDFEVYTGSCGNLFCFSGDDDGGIISCNAGNTNSYLSIKTFNVTAGTTYYICWTNRYNTNGFDFQLIETPIGSNPCLSSTPITAGITTVNAIDEANITTACSTAPMAKWYSYTPTQDYEVTITSDLIENICKDTNFSVYTGNCSSLTCFTSDDNAGIIQCNSGNTNSNLSTRTFIATAGTTYYIAWDNRWSATGFNFELTEVVIPPPPVSYTTQTINTINSSYNICVVDMNGDYKDDIVGVSTNNLKIHYQGVSGAFSITDFPVTGISKMPNWSLAAGDYNRDNYNDLILGSGYGLSVWTSNSTGTAYSSYTPGEDIFCQRTNFADLNNDGNLDVFSCHDIAPNVYYLNDGNGNLTYYQTSVTPGAMNLGSIRGNYATLFTDFDNDGDTDLFVSKCSGPTCELHRNDGNGVYTDISAIAQINITPIQSWSSAIADFDNDGDMDILIGSNGNTGHVFFRNNLDTSNNVEEAYTNITDGSGWDNDNSINRDYVAYDFDNDGYVDVLGSGNKIMFNQGNNTFSPVSYNQGISVGAIGDLNDDGFLDILNGNTVRYAIPNGNNWIKVTLKGVQSNSNGIGARVEIYGAWGKQIRDIRSGEGFEYMSSLNAHFGIGQETEISQVVINWPSGTVDVIDNPLSNQVLHVIEGSFPLSSDNFASNKVTIYPNPSNHFLTIRNIDKIEVAGIDIFTTTGQLVKTIKDDYSTISISDLTNGVYILTIKTLNGEKFSKSFIKKD